MGHLVFSHRQVVLKQLRLGVRAPGYVSGKIPGGRNVKGGRRGFSVFIVIDFKEFESLTFFAGVPGADMGDPWLEESEEDEGIVGFGAPPGVEPGVEGPDGFFKMGFGVLGVEGCKANVIKRD